MKFMYSFTCVFALINIFSCNKQSTKSEARYTLVVFKIENALGQNLFDPATTGYYRPENIKVFYLVNGEEKLYSKPNLDYPHGYRILNSSAIGYYMTIFANTEATESPTTTYIDWGNGDKDTLVCAMNKKDGVYQMITDAWYNNEKINNIAGGLNILKIVK